jgi:hypothetical protein
VTPRCSTRRVAPRFRNVPILQRPIERDVLQRIFVVAAKAAVAG